jgi:uncharacterized protein YjcR
MEKKTPKHWVSTYFTPTLLIGAVIGGAFYFGAFKKDSESKQFESSSQKEKTRQHIDSDYNEVKNYQLMQEQKQMKVELDTAYAYVNALFKEDRAARLADSLNSVDAVKSRAVRDSLNIQAMRDVSEIQREQKIISNQLFIILEHLKDTVR